MGTDHDFDEIETTPSRSGTTEPLPQVACPPLALRFEDGREVRIERRLTIGKGRGSDVRLAEDAHVSALHCVVDVAAGGRWRVYDQRSANGTFVGGVRVESAQLLPGVQLVVGRTLLRVVVANLARGAQPAVVELIGDSPVMRQLDREITRVAPSRANVLVLGESGTGKELVARALHRMSGRRGALITLNCGAIAAGLVESELFGHERGAFTGATVRRLGVFEEADGGTLFLDEIGELPVELQPRLLRALETGLVRSVGGEGERRVDVRVVSATLRDLGGVVGEGRFRDDLFHRLATVEVRLPPLRERPSDIPLLAAHLLAGMASDLGPRQLSSAALAIMREHVWPGNVRELRNALHRACIFGGPVLEPADVLPRGAQRAMSPKSGATMQSIERRAMSEALRRTGGNRRRAAAQLGVPKSTFCEKVRRYGIRVDED